MSPAVTVIVVVPSNIAVTRPALSTVATASSFDVYVIAWSGSTVALIEPVAPSSIVKEEGSTVNIVSTGSKLFLLLLVRLQDLLIQMRHRYNVLQLSVH